MKKLILILTLLALSGCGQKTSPAAPTSPETAPDVQASATSEVPETSATAPTEDRNPTAAELGREEKMDLVLMVEVME